MGWLRLLLALSVLFEHTGGIGGYTIIGGPLAVQCFFIISGFYMGLVLNERYDRPALNRAFYANRAFRILGTYWAMLALYLCVFLLADGGHGASPLWVYREVALPWGDKGLLALLNLTVVGQEVPLWLRIDHGHLAWTTHALHSGGVDVFHFMLIPMAWSLALEIEFYAIAPFVARRPWPQVAGLMAASLGLRGVAAGFGLVDDPFSYRFFPFELALFLAGVLGYRAFAANRGHWEGRWGGALALMVPCAICVYPAWAGCGAPNVFFEWHRLALLTLVACGLPAGHARSRYIRRDRAVGELSYPLYLDHLLVYGMVAGVPVLAGNPGLRTLAAAALSIALARVIVRFLERRIDAVRQRLAARAGASDVVA